MHLAVESRNTWSYDMAQEWKVQVIAVKVNHIKFRRLTKNQFHHPDVVRQRLPAIRITPKSTIASRDQACVSF